MKKVVVLMMMAAFMAAFMACERIDFDENGQAATSGESQLILKAGIISGSETYVQKDVNTGIVLTSKNVNNPVTEASWTIENQDYVGLNITHKFLVLGTVQIVVTAKFQDKTTETRNFSVKVIQDISPYDPILFFVGQAAKIANGKWVTYNRWPVTILVSKERLANKTMYGYSGSFNDDAPSVWFSGIKIPNTEANYIVENGLPKQVTGDVGKYVAIKLDLLERDYAMAVGEFEKADGSGVFMWADWSGSKTVTASKNVGMIEFRMNSNGTITPLGDGYLATTEPLPATNGDDGAGIFRYELTAGKLVAYFKLSDEFSKLTPFMTIKNQETGAWSEPIALTAVAGFPKYGKIEMNKTSALNVLTSVRFGNTLSTKVVDYVQMAKSSHYSETLKEIRFTVVEG